MLRTLRTTSWINVICVFLFFGCQDGTNYNKEESGNDKIKILTVGGGSSHDYDTWFNKKDGETLADLGVDIRYTEDVSIFKSALDTMDILFITTNQAIPDPLDRKAIFDFAANGNSLMLVHPPVWYNWEDWPEWNQNMVGGGSRGHGPYGLFQVDVVDAGHPVMQGISSSFELEDELYRVVLDSTMANTHVLAEAVDQETGITHPLVWTVEHPNAKILCIALGHDDKAHNHPDYQKLIRNGVSWLND